MVRSRSVRLLLAWLLLVTGLAGSARGALGLGCHPQGQADAVRAHTTVIAPGHDAQGGSTPSAMAEGSSQRSVPPASPAPGAQASVCTSAPALPTRPADLAHGTQVVPEVASWRQAEHASFVPASLFHPPRLG